jgi:hypothetical protein
MAISCLGRRDLPFSTGNKGVDQTGIRFFGKCGIVLILFLLILALFCMTGCLERSRGPSSVLSSSQPYQVSNSSLQMDFDVELASDLFRVQGNLLLPGNGSLSYLLLNSSLSQGMRPIVSTRYLMMQIEPNQDCSFEICKNAKIPAGKYDFTLRAEGPQGVLFEGKRQVVQDASGPSIGRSGSWTEIEEAAFWHGVAEGASSAESLDHGQASSNEPTRSGSAADDGVDFGQEAAVGKSGINPTFRTLPMSIHEFFVFLIKF